MTAHNAKPGYENCGAKTRAGGSCGRPAGWGTDHVGHGQCKLHGGSTRNGRKHAQREIATEAVRLYGLPREVDPFDALREELWRTCGWVQYLDALVQSGAMTSAQNPTGKRRTIKLDQSTLGGDVPSVWKQMLDNERAHYVKVAKTCIDAGLDRRMVEIAEEQGQLIAQVIRGVLDDLGVKESPEVATVVRKHLSLVAS